MYNFRLLNFGFHNEFQNRTEKSGTLGHRVQRDLSLNELMFIFYSSKNRKYLSRLYPTCVCNDILINLYKEHLINCFGYCLVNRPAIEYPPRPNWILSPVVSSHQIGDGRSVEARRCSSVACQLLYSHYQLLCRELTLRLVRPCSELTVHRR